MELSTALEQEVKFEAPIALALPDLRSLVGGTTRLPDEYLVTRYFDTRDSRLWERGLTLRHRSQDQGPDGVWTLKLPSASAGGPALERTEVSWPGLSHEIPSAAGDILRGVVRHESLHQITTLEKMRHRLVLRDDEDHELAELDDDIVRVVGGPRDGARFRQVELETRDRSWEWDRVLHRLEKAGARIEHGQKLAKALGLPTRPATRVAIDRQSSVADVIGAAIRSGFDRLVDHDWRLRIDVPHPAAHDVHQARVATRRLRSDLKMFGDFVDAPWVRKVRKDLKWLGAVLGELRDRDVLADGFSEPPLEIEQRLAVQRLEAGQQLSEVLASRRYLDLLDRLHAASDQLPVAFGADVQRAAKDVLPSLVHARWRAVRERVRRADTPPSPGQLHQIRIKSKQLRYGAEVATPVCGKPARRTASAAERVQTVLGDHHDAVAAEAWLRDQWSGDGSRTGPEAGQTSVSFEAGRLVAEERQHQLESEEQWRHAWAKLRAPKRRSWLRRR